MSLRRGTRVGGLFLEPNHEVAPYCGADWPSLDENDRTSVRMLFNAITKRLTNLGRRNPRRFEVLCRALIAWMAEFQRSMAA